MRKQPPCFLNFTLLSQAVLHRVPFTGLQVLRKKRSFCCFKKLKGREICKDEVQLRPPLEALYESFSTPTEVKESSFRTTTEGMVTRPGSADPLVKTMRRKLASLIVPFGSMISTASAPLLCATRTSQKNSHCRALTFLVTAFFSYSPTPTTHPPPALVYPPPFLPFWRRFRHVFRSIWNRFRFDFESRLAIDRHRPTSNSKSTPARGASMAAGNRLGGWAVTENRCPLHFLACLPVPSLTISSFPWVW